MISRLFVLALAATGSFVNGLPSPSPLAPRDCSAEASALNAARAAKRGLDTRSIYFGPVNTTCILAPESSKTNYVSGAPASTDVTSGQAGVEFVIDVALMDITTCKVLPNTMVEIWGPNALGNYGNFLRGGTTSNSGGIAEIKTIYPGWSSDGATHVNIGVHTSSSMSSSTMHVGKLYFTDAWTTLLGNNASPYGQNTHSRTMNMNDPDYVAALSKGYYPVIDTTTIGDDWTTGVVGIITVGVNPHK